MSQSSVDLGRIDFTRIEGSSKDLQERFKRDVAGCHEYDLTSRALLETVNDSGFTLLPYRCQVENLYLFFLKGKADSHLIRLGRKTGLPRGFPIVWKPGEYINLYGFYPKFENDQFDDPPEEEDRQEDISEVAIPAEFQEAEFIDFNYKYSGYLGQVIAFRDGGNLYWTTCAKNSTGNEYSDNLARIIAPKLTQGFLRRLVEEQVHFCGETMAFFDQKHGARVLREDLVTTCVGRGHWIDVAKREVLGYNPTVPGNNMFVDFFGQSKMKDYCMANRLSVDSIFTIRGTANVGNFLFKLSENRNFIDLERFSEFVAEARRKMGDAVIESPGNVSHRDILGNVLEGLIIKINYREGSGKTKKTVKYKFPFYTVRTMFLRSYLESNPGFKNSVAYAEGAERYVKRWVVNDRIGGRDYWRYLLALLYLRYDEFRESWPGPDEYGQHIHLVDELRRQPEFKFDPEANYKKLTLEVRERRDSEMMTMPSCDLIVSMGPIGGGKSTFSELLRQCHSGLVHIDGDVLDLTRTDVPLLGEERNPYTRYSVIRPLLQGQIPIISQGGGVFLSFGKDSRVVFFEELSAAFQGRINFRVTVTLPYLSTGTEDEPVRFLTGEALDRFVGDVASFRRGGSTSMSSHLKELQEMYRDKEALRTSLNQRGWDIGLLNELIKRNLGNFNIALQVIENLSTLGMLEQIVCYPKVTPENRDAVLRLLKDTSWCGRLSGLRNEIEPSIPPKFMQKRILCSYTIDGTKQFHHITCRFDPQRQLVPSRRDLDVDSLESPGVYYMVPNRAVLHYFDRLRRLVDRDGSDSAFDELKEMLTGSNFQNINAIRNRRADYERVLTVLKKYCAGKLNKDRDESYRELNDHLNSAINGEIVKRESWYYSFIRFDRQFPFCGEERHETAHITVNTGNVHAPVSTRLFVEALNQIEDGQAVHRVLVPKKSSKETVDYTLIDGGSTIQGQPLTVTLHQVFYVV
jgi:hypothetical protein